MSLTILTKVSVTFCSTLLGKFSSNVNGTHKPKFLAYHNPTNIKIGVGKYYWINFTNALVQATAEWHVCIFPT